MAEKKSKPVYSGSLNFDKENYKWMIIGAVIIIIGMFLLSGGENKDPNVFNQGLVYSTRRITIAPITILVGFAVEIYAILKKPAVKKEEA